MKKLKYYIKKIIRAIRRPEMETLPGQVAFSLVLSIAPILTLLVVVASFFSIDLNSVIDFMTETFPKDVSDLLIPLISGKGFDIGIGFSMIVGFFIASNGPHSIIVASNLLYKKENSDYIKRRIKAFFLTIILVGVFIFSLIVLAFGNHILKLILDFGILKDIGEKLYFIFVLLKWPIAFFIVFFTVKFLYTVTPDFRLPSRYVNKGALFATLGWIVVTAIYSYYVSNFARYSLFYGGLSNFVILMIWIYFLSYILMIGIAINASDYDLEKSAVSKE